MLRGYRSRRSLDGSAGGPGSNVPACLGSSARSHRLWAGPEFELDRAVASTRTAEGVHTVTVTRRLEHPERHAQRRLRPRARAEAPSRRSPRCRIRSQRRSPTSGRRRRATPRCTSRPLRLGRRVATFDATLHQDDKPVVHAVVSFHDADADGRPPAPPHEEPADPAPDDCIDVMSARAPRRPCRSSTASTIATRACPLDGGTPSGDTSATYWVRLKDRRPIDALAAAVLVDAYPPVTVRDRSAEVGDRPAHDPLPAPTRRPSGCSLASSRVT